MSKEEINKASGVQKISFILNKYFLKETSESSRKKIKKFADNRNRIVHFGKKEKEMKEKEMKNFIDYTQELVAIALKIEPKWQFNSTKWYDHLFEEEGSKK